MILSWWLRYIVSGPFLAVYCSFSYNPLPERLEPVRYETSHVSIVLIPYP